jgi:hypothetical protein
MNLINEETDILKDRKPVTSAHPDRVDLADETTPALMSTTKISQQLNIQIIAQITDTRHYPV